MKKIFQIGFLLALSGLLSRILGFFRDAWIARFFGLSGEGIWNIDAYYLAFKIPDLLYQILIAGMISVSLIPVYYSLKEEDRGFFLAQTARVLIVVFLFMVGVLYMFMPSLLSWIAPGLGSESILLSVDLARILLLSTFLLGCSTLFQTMAQIQERYWGMMLSPILYNLGALFGLTFWVKEQGVYGLIYGILLGACMSLCLQIIHHRSWKTLYYFGPKYMLEAMKKLLQSAQTRFLGIVILQLMMLLDIFWLSFMKEGSIALMSYLINIQSIVLGLISVSLSTAMFNSLNQCRGDLKAWRNMVLQGFYGILAFVWPALLGLYFMIRPLLDWILPASEKYDLSSFKLDSLSIFLALNLLPIVSIHYLNRVYFSQNEYKKVNYLSLITFFVYQLFLIGFFLLGSLDLQNLMVAFFIANLMSFFLYLYYLQKDFALQFFQIKLWKEAMSIFTSGLFMLCTLSAWIHWGPKLVVWQEILVRLSLGLTSFSILALSFYWLLGRKKKIQSGPEASA